MSGPLSQDISVQELRRWKACREGLLALSAGMGWPDWQCAEEIPEDSDHTFTLLDVLNRGRGVEDAIWALRCLDGADREIRLLACWCASQVLHLASDARCLRAVRISILFALGEATEAELGAAHAAARTAAWAAALAATDATSRAAARDAAESTSWAAARTAAWAVADAAVSDQLREWARNPEAAELWAREWLAKNSETSLDNSPQDAE